MKPGLRKFLYGLLVVLMILDFYAIFNAGNPASIYRYVIHDPAYDVTFTVFLSLLIVAIAVSMRASNDETSIRSILNRNRAHIEELRRQGKSDWEISESFLREIGLKRRLFRNLLRRRVLRHLRRL